jgi:hypothetical protein
LTTRFVFCTSTLLFLRSIARKYFIQALALKYPWFGNIPECKFRVEYDLNFRNTNDHIPNQIGFLWIILGFIH